MKGKFIALLLMSVMIVSTFATSASAATYSTSSERGVKYLGWSQSKLLWSITSGKVTASDAYQDHSGLLVRNKGKTKVTSLTSSTQHAWHYKNEFLAGAKIGGVTLGYSDTITDRIIGKSNAKSTHAFDI